MKKVEIKNKVVARGGGKEVKPSAATGADLSGVLMKSVWDEAFAIRETEDGEMYLQGKLPMALENGMATYVDADNPDLPGIYDGLPIDNRSIYWKEVTQADGKKTRILKADASGLSAEWDGYVVLVKDVPLDKQMVYENTIYEIRYDFDLCGEVLDLPTSTILKFIGGRFFNGTINFNGGCIEASPYVQIFKNVALTGELSNNEFSVKWWGAKGDYVEDYSTKGKVADDVEAFHEVLSVLQNLKRGTMYVPKGVYGINNIRFDFENITSFFAYRRGSTFGLKGEGSLNSVLVFQKGEDGVYFNSHNKQFAEVFVSDIQIFGKNSISDNKFTSHSPNDYVHENSSFNGDIIGLAVNQSGYKSTIERVNITGFRIGFANTRAYGGPYINNVFVDNCGIGYIGKGNTTVVHVNCNYIGVESCYMVQTSAESLTNVVCEGNLNYFNSENVTELAKHYLGNGFDIRGTSRVLLQQCYTEYLFGASRYIANSIVEDINGQVGNTLHYWLTTNIPKQAFKDYFNGVEDKRVFAPIKFVATVRNFNVGGLYKSSNILFDFSGNNTTPPNLSFEFIPFDESSGSQLYSVYPRSAGKYHVNCVQIDLNATYQSTENILSHFLCDGIEPVITYNNGSVFMQKPKIIGNNAEIFLDQDWNNQFLGSKDKILLSRYNLNGNLTTENYTAYTNGVNGFSLGMQGQLDSTMHLMAHMRKSDTSTGKNTTISSKELAKFGMQTGRVQFPNLQLKSAPASPSQMQVGCLYIDGPNYAIVTPSENLQKAINAATGCTYAKRKGNSNERPALGDFIEDWGAMYYDYGIKKYIMWNGTAWVNLDGTPLVAETSIEE